MLSVQTPVPCSRPRVRVRVRVSVTLTLDSRVSALTVGSEFVHP